MCILLEYTHIRFKIVSTIIDEIFKEDGVDPKKNEVLIESVISLFFNYPYLCRHGFASRSPILFWMLNILACQLGHVSQERLQLTRECINKRYIWLKLGIIFSSWICHQLRSYIFLRYSLEHKKTVRKKISR